MDSGSVVMLVFIILTVSVMVLVVILSQQGKAGLKFLDKAEMYIEFDKGGWQPAKQTSKPVKPAASPQLRPVASSTTTWLTAGSRKRWKYSLDSKAQVTLGRHPDNQIWLRHDPAAEARHAVIDWDNARGRYRLTNLSSQNPVRVNGRTVTWQYLGDGNSIRIGNTVLVFRTQQRR